MIVEFANMERLKVSLSQKVFYFSLNLQKRVPDHDPKKDNDLALSFLEILGKVKSLLRLGHPYIKIWWIQSKIAFQAIFSIPMILSK